MQAVNAKTDAKADKKRKMPCPCVSAVNTETMFLEIVLDLAQSLSEVMIVCGIHSCKAKAAVETIVHALLEYDQVCYCADPLPKQRLRKEDIFCDLAKKSMMNRVEAMLAYNIIKRGFKALYYKLKDTCPLEAQIPPPNAEECVWVHAATRTADFYAKLEGASCEERRAFEAKIRCIYKRFYERLQQRKEKPSGEECECCFCSERRALELLEKAQEQVPCPKPAPKKKKPRCCPKCCLPLKKCPPPKKRLPVCPKCRRTLRFCICEKYQFAINWVDSIWTRPDFEEYYKETIDEKTRSRYPKGDCRFLDSQEDVRKSWEDAAQAQATAAATNAAERGKSGRNSGGHNRLQYGKRPLGGAGQRNPGKKTAEVTLTDKDIKTDMRFEEVEKYGIKTRTKYENKSWDKGGYKGTTNTEVTTKVGKGINTEEKKTVTRETGPDGTKSETITIVITENNKEGGKAENAGATAAAAMPLGFTGWPGLGNGPTPIPIAMPRASLTSDMRASFGVLTAPQGFFAAPKPTPLMRQLSPRSANGGV